MKKRFKIGSVVQLSPQPDDYPELIELIGDIVRRQGDRFLVVRGKGVELDCYKLVSVKTGDALKELRPGSKVLTEVNCHQRFLRLDPFLTAARKAVKSN